MRNINGSWMEENYFKQGHLCGKSTIFPFVCFAAASSCTTHDLQNVSGFPHPTITQTPFGLNYYLLRQMFMYTPLVLYPWANLSLFTVRWFQFYPNWDSSNKTLIDLGSFHIEPKRNFGQRGAYRYFHAQSNPTYPFIHPLIAFEHLSLYVQRHLDVASTN